MKIRYPLIALFALSSIFFASCGSTKVDAATEDNKTEENASDGKKADEGVSEDFSEKNQALLAKVEEARKNAIDAGAQTYYPELFKETESKNRDVADSVEKNPNADHSAALNDLIARYESMEYASLAKGLQKKAGEMGGSDLDANLLKKGNDALAKYDDVSANGSGSDMLAQAKAAYDSYSDLLNKGFIALAGKERKAALAAKKDAESVKAQVAKKTKEAYAKASETFKNADKSYSVKKIEPAYEGYKAAKESWAQMYETVKKDREETEARLAEAKKKVEEAARNAENADKESPLTEKVAGIEDEDAVLLEKDKFANPDDAISDVESGTVAEQAEKIADEAISEEEDVKAAEDATFKSIDNPSTKSDIDAK